MIRRAKPALLLIGIGLLGCAPYSFSGGRTALVASITVPIFENQTPEFGLAEDLTQGIINGFVEDNQVKVVDASAAEAILTGRIVDYKRRAYTFDATDRVSEYIVEIWVTADLTKKGEETPVWAVERMRGFGPYKADSEDEQKGQERAIAKLAEDLLNRTIKSW
ncbi:MAG: LptE family protein [Candidatus Zixiibacteriota bacterium]